MIKVELNKKNRKRRIFLICNQQYNQYKYNFNLFNDNNRLKHNFDVKYKAKLTINVNYTIFVYNQFLPLSFSGQILIWFEKKIIIPNVKNKQF